MRSPFIAMFNYENQKYISKAAIKSQASLNNFYDNDNSIENALGIIENAAAKSFKIIDKTNSIPSPSSLDHINILIFTFYQLSRTKTKASEVQTSINKFYQQIYKDDPQFKKFFKEYELRIEKPATFALGNISRIIHLTFDLKVKLIINKTKFNFITSDNPVIKYNQFLERRKQPGGITGIGLKGIQYFLPLDSKKCLIFYDDITYKVGKRYNDRITLKFHKDIELLNILQLLNCDTNIYFNESTDIQYIKELYQKSKSFKKAGLQIINEYPQEITSKGNQASLLHSYTTDLKIGLDLSFIKETRRAKKYRMGNKAVHLRNEKFNDLNIPASINN